MKKFLSVAAVLLLAAALAAAGGGRERKAAEGPRYVVGLSIFSLEEPWRAQGVEEIRRAVETLHAGRVLELIVPEPDGTAEKQISDLEALIERGVDAILLSASNPRALVPVVEKAVEAGIVVVDFDRPVGTDRVTAHVVVDDREYGRVQAEWLAEAIKGVGDIIVFNGTEGAPESEERRAGALEAFARYPEIQIVQEVYAGGDPVRARKAMETVLVVYPRISGIWSQSGAMSQAIVEAYLAGGRCPPPVTGQDTNGFLKAWVQARNRCPEWTSIAASIPAWWGVRALEAALEALGGGRVKKSIVIPIPVITSETLDRYVRPDLPDEHRAHTRAPQEDQ